MLLDFCFAHHLLICIIFGENNVKLGTSEKSEIQLTHVADVMGVF